MMKSTLLMSSVAVAALAAPAFAGPDRFDQGTGCTGMSGTECVQAQMRLEDGNRLSEKSSSNTIDNTAAASTGGTFSAARAGDSDDFGDEVGAVADDASGLASEAGAGIASAANDAGDAISDAADEAGDAISDAFD